MKYTVTWKPSVKERLADIWMTAPDRSAVTAAANSVDSLLRVDPLDRGESRGGITRVLVVLPLAVVYEVNEDDRQVQVLSVRHVPVRRQGGE
jgi:plasmid stabilization system protein ParE